MDVSDDVRMRWRGGRIRSEEINAEVVFGRPLVELRLQTREAKLNLGPVRGNSGVRDIAPLVPLPIGNGTFPTVLAKLLKQNLTARAVVHQGKPSKGQLGLRLHGRVELPERVLFDGRHTIACYHDPMADDQSIVAQLQTVRRARGI